MAPRVISPPRLHHRRPKTAGSRNGNARRCATRSSKPRRSSAVGNATRSWRRRPPPRKGPLRLWRRKRRRRKAVRRQGEPEEGGQRPGAGVATRRRRAVASRVSFALQHHVQAPHCIVYELGNEKKRVADRQADERVLSAPSEPRFRGCSLTCDRDDARRPRGRCRLLASPTTESSANEQRTVLDRTLLSLHGRQRRASDLEAGGRV